ncbi:MAG: hypothetical protein PVG02_00650, partial [Anaerolineales bacterium]
MSDQQIPPSVTAKHTNALREGFKYWPHADEPPPALGDQRWTADLILSNWEQAETGQPGAVPREHQLGASGGGFDLLDF